MPDISRTVVGVFSDQEMKKTGTKPATTSQRRNASGHPVFQCSHPLERGQFKCRREKQLFSSRPIQASPYYLLVSTIWAVNQLTIYHAVSIWYDQVKKMHQGEPDFDLDLDLSVNNVTTFSAACYT